MTYFILLVVSAISFGFVLGAAVMLFVMDNNDTHSKMKKSDPAPMTADDVTWETVSPMLKKI